MFNLTKDQIDSGLRHIYTAVGTATATLVTLGLTSSGDANTISNAVHQIGDGVAMIVAGVTALTPFVMGAWAMLSASLGSRLKSLAKDPEVKQVVVVTPAVADAVPSTKVIAK